MSQQPVEDQLWSDLLLAERQFADARGRLLATHGSLHSVLEPALRDPTQRRTALRVLQTLDEPTRREYFSTLVELASVAHVDIMLVRDVLLSLDTVWVRSNIWLQIEETLKTQGTDEEYRRYAEILHIIDARLLGKLVGLALQSEDADVREVAEDFALHAASDL
jgi:hypothetical protein